MREGRESRAEASRRKVLSRSCAFRQTFLSAMPLSEEKIYREFGYLIYRHGLEMTRYPPHRNTPYNREALSAVLFDLEYIEKYLRESLDTPEEAQTAGEARLAVVAGVQRQKLLEIIESLQGALHRRRRPASE
jgi:hypothetical protein